MTIQRAVPTSRFLLLPALAAMALIISPAAAEARPLVGKDGKIHACYKWKGKKKGALRVVRGPKVRCPRKWKKVSWHARKGFTPGAPAAIGPAGPQGERGLPADSTAVEQLEAKVSELLTRVEELETLIPTVQTLCTQVATLTTQVNAVEGALAGLNLNAVLTTLGGVLNIPPLPGALPAFNCPTG
ncbi:MAG TPA: hypothetical protein VFT79_01750 [Solirubrobacterales bacterium]|nr:hypothetical protein [Solirubrobacterales bacterium]